GAGGRFVAAEKGGREAGRATPNRGEAGRTAGSGHRSAQRRVGAAAQLRAAGRPTGGGVVSLGAYGLSPGRAGGGELGANGAGQPRSNRLFEPLVGFAFCLGPALQ